jgi:hypothetical protein
MSKIEKGDVNGIFDEMFGEPASIPEGRSATVPQSRSATVPQRHRPAELQDLSAVEPWFHSAADPQSPSTIPNIRSAEWIGGTQKRRGVYLYEGQYRRLRHLVTAGQDMYGMGLNESVVARCALELLLRIGIEPHQGMTETELWEAVVKGAVKMNTPELMLCVEAALKKAGLKDKADLVLSELRWLLDTCTPDEIRQMSDE